MKTLLFDKLKEILQFNNLDKLRNSETNSKFNTIIWLFALNSNFTDNCSLKKNFNFNFISKKLRQNLFRRYFRHYIMLDRRKLPFTIFSNFSIIGSYSKLYSKTYSNTPILKRNKRIWFKKFININDYKIKNTFFGIPTIKTDDIFLKLFIYENNASIITQGHYNREVFLHKLFSRNIFFVNASQKPPIMDLMYFDDKTILKLKNISEFKNQYFGFNYDEITVNTKFFLKNNEKFCNLGHKYVTKETIIVENRIGYSNFNLKLPELYLLTNNNTRNLQKYKCHYTWTCNSDIFLLNLNESNLSQFFIKIGTKYNILNFIRLLKPNTFDHLDFEYLSIYLVQFYKYCKLVQFLILKTKFLRFNEIKELSNQKFFFHFFVLRIFVHQKEIFENGIYIFNLNKTLLSYRTDLPNDFYFLFTFIVLIRTIILIKTEEPEKRLFFFKTFTKFLTRKWKFKKMKISIFSDVNYMNKLMIFTNCRPFTDSMYQTDHFWKIITIKPNVAITYKYLFFPFTLFSQNLKKIKKNSDFIINDLFFMKYIKLNYLIFIKKIINLIIQENFQNYAQSNIDSFLFWKLESIIKIFSNLNSSVLLKTKKRDPNFYKLTISFIDSNNFWKLNGNSILTHLSFSTFLTFNYNPNLNAAIKYSQNLMSSRTPLSKYLDTGLTNSHFNFFTYFNYDNSKKLRKIQKMENFITKYNDLDEFFYDQLNFELLWFDSLGTRTSGNYMETKHKFGFHHENTDNLKFSKFLWETAHLEDKIQFFDPNFLIFPGITGNKIFPYYFFNYFEENSLYEFSSQSIYTDLNLFRSNSSANFYYFNFLDFDLSLFTIFKNILELDEILENTYIRKISISSNFEQFRRYRKFHGTIFWKNIEFSRYLMNFFFSFETFDNKRNSEITFNTFYSFGNLTILDLKAGILFKLILVDFLIELLDYKLITEADALEFKKLLDSEIYWFDQQIRLIPKKFK